MGEGRFLGGEVVCDDGRLCRLWQRWKRRIEIASAKSDINVSVGNRE